MGHFTFQSIQSILFVGHLRENPILQMNQRNRSTEPAIFIYLENIKIDLNSLNILQWRTDSDRKILYLTKMFNWVLTRYFGYITNG